MGYLWDMDGISMRKYRIKYEEEDIVYAETGRVKKKGVRSVSDTPVVLICA